MSLKSKYKQNIEDHFTELHKKISALQAEHVKKIMNYITHGDTNMTPKPTFETVPVTFESDNINYVDSRTPEEREEQRKIQESVVVTTASAIESDTVKDTKNILDNNGNLKDTSEFQRSEANRASLEKHISESDKEKVWKNIDGSIVGTKEVTFESDNSWMDCDKCDVNGPCAEHSVDESDKWREPIKEWYRKNGAGGDGNSEEIACLKLQVVVESLLSKERNKVRAILDRYYACGGHLCEDKLIKELEELIRRTTNDIKKLSEEKGIIINK